MTERTRGSQPRRLRNSHWRITAVEFRSVKKHPMLKYCTNVQTFIQLLPAYHEDLFKTSGTVTNGQT
jgi:hypothetical protein